MNRLMLAATLVLGSTLPALAEKAIVAGGCFWCVESDFEAVPGVNEVVSGYTGGTLENPTYKQVGRGTTGHVEAVEIDFDPARISYDEVLRLFFRSVDPTDPDGQFCDRGEVYRTAIFPLNAAQTAAAKAAKAAAEADLEQKVVTEITAAGTFWPAEDYHQDYYKGEDIVLTRRGPKSRAAAYTFYRDACGRDARVKELWGDAAPFADKH